MNRASTRRGAARGAGAAAAGAVLGVGSVNTAAAHHSFPATYDTAQEVSVSGVVQLVRFTNPHVHIVIESPLAAPALPAGAGPLAPAAPEATPAARPGSAGAAGATDAADAADAGTGAQPAGRDAAPGATRETTLWVLDLPGPGRAEQIGLTPETLPPGTPLSIVAWPPRAAGSHDLAPLTITFDGSGLTVRIR